MKVTFPSTHNAFQVTAPKGTMISFSGTPTEVVDGVYVIGDEGSINIDDGFLTDTIYLSTTGEDYTVAGSARVAYPAEGVIIRAGASVLPFKKKAKGGESITVTALSVTENGTYTAPLGTAYSPVTVSVPIPSGLIITNFGLYDFEPVLAEAE